MPWTRDRAGTTHHHAVPPARTSDTSMGTSHRTLSTCLSTARGTSDETVERRAPLVARETPRDYDSDFGVIGPDARTVRRRCVETASGPHAARTGRPRRRACHSVCVRTAALAGSTVVFYAPAFGLETVVHSAAPILGGQRGWKPW
jgi:hypothetical protein